MSSDHLIHRQLSSDRSWFAALGILVGFVLLALWFSLTVPAFETPDEIFHYAFVRHLAQGNSLPIQSSESTGPWEQEGSQAPLYYLIGGLLTAGIDQGDFEQINVRNPRANLGSPFEPGNKNLMLYSGQWRPLTGTNLALHVLRWFSVLLGTITLWFTYLTTRLIFPDRPHIALLAMATLAAIPQFGFISAACSNDILITAVSAVTIYWLARMWLSETATDRENWRWGMLGLLLGVAALSKLQAFGLIGLAGLVGMWITYEDRAWRLLPQRVLLVALPLLAIAGWWYWRNYTLYGDWLGTGHLTSINGNRSTPLDWASFVNEFRGVRYSFWGLFGWFSIPLSVWFYRLLDGMTGIGLFGFVLQFVIGVRSRLGSPAQASALATQHGQALKGSRLLVGWLGLSLTLLVYWMTQALGGQGRLIFPAIGVLCILIVVGIDQWLSWIPNLLRRTGQMLLPLTLFVATLYSLVILIPASYHAAPAVNRAIGLPVNLRYVDTTQPDTALELLSIQVADDRFAINDTLPITAYMRSESRLQQDYQLFIQLLDDTGAEFANMTTHPGWGRNPTSLWQPGAIYADHYQLQAFKPIDRRSPLLARIYAGFIQPNPDPSVLFPMPAYDETDNEITPFLGTVVVIPQPPANRADIPNAQPIESIFGGVIKLDVARWGSVIDINQAVTSPVTLLWQAIGQPATDYTAFVHLRDASGVQIAGVDHPPAGVRLPTQHWRTGDTILDEYELVLSGTLPETLPETLPGTLAVGTYQLWVGLYESGSDGALRLPVTDAGRAQGGDGQVMIGEVVVE